MLLKYTVNVRKREKKLIISLLSFDTDQISVPPAPPSTQPAKNEIEVGRLFQAIQAHKRLSIEVPANYAHAIHTFLEAQKSHAVLDVDINLFRYAMIREDKTGFTEVTQTTFNVAILRLTQVQIVSFIPTEADTYVATFMVTGQMNEQDFDEN